MTATMLLEAPTAPQFQAISTVRGTLEQRRHERLISRLPVRFTILGGQSAKDLAIDDAYSNSTMEKFSSMHRPETSLKSVTADLCLGGFSLHSTLPVSPGSSLLCELSLPSFSRPLRLLALAVPPASGSRAFDQTATVFKVGLQIIAINRTDMTKIENHFVEQRIWSRQSRSG